MKRNMGSFDRILRVLVAIIFGVLFFAKMAKGTLGVILLIIALIFLLTSIFGYCPLYSIIKVSTKRSE